MNLNKINLIKQIDLFKRPIMMRTERSVEGFAWDKQGGSFVGAVVSIIIFVSLSVYSDRVLDAQR